MDFGCDAMHGNVGSSMSWLPIRAPVLRPRIVALQLTTMTGLRQKSLMVPKKTPKVPKVPKKTLVI